MFCLRFRRNTPEGQQAIKHVRGLFSVCRSNSQNVGAFQLLNNCRLRPNLEVAYRNVISSNSFGGYTKIFFKMEERLKRRQVFKNVVLAHLKKDLKFKPMEPWTSKSPLKLPSVNARNSDVAQLNNGPNSVFLKPVYTAAAAGNDTSKFMNIDRETVLYHKSNDFPLEMSQNRYTNGQHNFDNENELMLNSYENKSEKKSGMQESFLHSFGRNLKYQRNEELPRLSPLFVGGLTFHDDLYQQPWDKRINVDVAPKNTLQNFLKNVVWELNSSSYLLKSPEVFKDINGMWSCKFSLAWPKPISFTGQGNSIKDASHNSAKQALVWLKTNNYMDDFGKPLFKELEKNHFSRKTMGFSKNMLLSGSTSCKVEQIRAYSTSSPVDLNANIVNSIEIPKNQDDSQDITLVRKLYPMPKNTLHNFFQILSNELNQKDLNPTPQYTLIKQKKSSSWMCTYNFKWPEPTKFSGIAQTKQEASRKAATASLGWLIQNKKITKDGRPLIYDKEEVRKITKKSYPSLAVNELVENNMNEIVRVYENYLVTQLIADLDEQKSMESVGEELDEKWPDLVDSDRFTQTNLGLDTYLAKEPQKLPISDYRNDIIDLLQANRVLIVKGEPGCGKSTRVPQYVLEAWAREGASDEQPCRIVVTQPRRIAAISLAERVANEREESVGHTVGYHVRLKSNFNKRTGRIMYCTTGILLRRLQSDPKLSDCSHIILDEAHERDVHTDLLLNLTRHALDLNPNLKVLVMSATMEAKVFQDYFRGAPVLHIPGFTYPVKETFLNENSFPKTYQMCMGQNANVVVEEVVQLIGSIHRNKPEGAILCFLPGWDDIMKVKSLIPERNDVSVLCLHSKLQVSEQRKIFSWPPPGVRKIILATNIAETSITIDDVVYVVDTGIHKEERFDVEKGVNCIDNHWISQASATQRKGRAGRCQPGECFHLYPKSKYEQFEPYSIPEILRTSLTKIVLDSKVYSNNMNAMEFFEQLVCPPDPGAIEKAVEELKELELLDENENLTPLGRTLSDFQLEPKLSKAMVNSVIFQCVTPIIDIATIFSAESALFAKTLGGQTEVKDAKMKFSKTSDHLALMRMFEQWLYFSEHNNRDEADEFCEDTGLVQYKLYTLQKLRKLHFDYLYKGLTNALPIDDKFSDNDELVKAVLLSGVGTVLQHRTWDFIKGMLKKTSVLVTRNNQKATITSESVNSRRSKFRSDFLLYINETMSNLRHTTLVRESSVISPLAVLLFKNGDLIIEEISKENYADKIQSKDQILLKLQGTKIGFLCDREQAMAIQKCKEVLRACVQYYIFQLTKGGECNEEVNFSWKEILRNLNEILITENVESKD